VDVIGDKESDAVSKKTVALTKHKCPCYRCQYRTKGLLIKSTSSPLLRCFTKAKLRKPLIQCQRVNQHNNFNSSSHPDNLSEGFTGTSEIATAWDTEERAPDSREIGNSWAFLPPDSEIRKCKAGDLHDRTPSLCYRCA